MVKYIKHSNKGLCVSLRAGHRLVVTTTILTLEPRVVIALLVGTLVQNKETSMPKLYETVRDIKGEIIDKGYL